MIGGFRLVGPDGEMIPHPEPGVSQDPGRAGVRATGGRRAGSDIASVPGPATSTGSNRSCRGPTTLKRAGESPRTGAWGSGGAIEATGRRGSAQGPGGASSNFESAETTDPDDTRKKRPTARLFRVRRIRIARFYQLRRIPGRTPHGSTRAKSRQPPKATRRDAPTAFWS